MKFGTNVNIFEMLNAKQQQIHRTGQSGDYSVDLYSGDAWF